MISSSFSVILPESTNSTKMDRRGRSPDLRLDIFGAQQLSDSSGGFFWQVSLVGEMRPVQDTMANLFEDPFVLTALQSGDPGQGMKIIEAELITATVQRHLVPCRPVPIRVVAENQIEGRCQGPVPALIHQEGNVLDVIVLVAAEDIEHGSSEKLLKFSHR
jgi:hypothetical protein